VTRRAVALVLLGALATGCVTSEAMIRGSGPTAATPTATPSPSPSPSPTVTPTPGPGEGPPDPDADIPARGVALARALDEAYRARVGAVDRWLADGDPSAWPPPRDAVLWTLYEQRTYRYLAAHEKLAGRVLGRLAPEIRREPAANVHAGRALFEHFTPVEEVPDFRIRKPEPADVLLGHFLEAEDRFGVEWEVLAAIMLVETRMGRIRSRSSAGARGPMQFLPATWEAYGLGGDVRDPRDAVLGAANYLAASGAPSDYRAALHAYNPVDAYVTAVWRYARTMMRSPESYYAYYDWQVFVRTVDGDVRLSGPGL
jgi:hypothetical protein